MSTDKNAGPGIGFATILFFIFLVLKLTGVVSWSWWWVFAPLWLPLGVMLILLACWGISEFIHDRNDPREQLSRWQRRIRELEQREERRRADERRGGT